METKTIKTTLSRDFMGFNKGTTILYDKNLMESNGGDVIICIVVDTENTYCHVLNNSNGIPVNNSEKEYINEIILVQRLILTLNLKISPVYLLSSLEMGMDTGENEDDPDEETIIVKLKQINEASLISAWDEFCSKYGVNYYALNEGRADKDDIAEITINDAKKWV